jgi:hypothetical protein
MLAAAAVALTCATTGGTARAEGSAVQLGLRTGYALPLGNGAGDTSLSDVVSGMIPIWIDAGYKLNPNMVIGANFQYGIAFVNSDKIQGCSGGGVSCSANDIMFGVQFHYHLMPDQTIDPWGGVGIGYEILNVSESAMGQSASTSFNGFQFVNFQLGADYKVLPNLGVGPFVMLSLGQYSNCSISEPGITTGNCTIQNQSMHEWLTFGVRGAYDIGL